MRREDIEKINKIVDEIMMAATIVDRVGSIMENICSDDDPTWDEYDAAVDAANNAIDYIYYLKYLFDN